MICPICASTVKNCPFCKTKAGFVIPETLIVIIQNVNQKYSKEQRDEALVALTQQFQYLIKKNTTYFYKTYGLKDKDYEYNDLYQDVILEFYDLVIKDFKIKAIGDNSLAVFGNYIKNKLYRRIQYGIQEKIKKYGWNKEISADLNILTEGLHQVSSGVLIGKENFKKEIYEATLANIISCEDQELEEIRDERCIQILKTIHEISFKEKVCSIIEGQIWRLHWFSGKSVEQIDDYLINEASYKTKIGESRIRQIVKNTNQKIIAEFGRVSAMGNIDV